MKLFRLRGKKSLEDNLLYSTIHDLPIDNWNNIVATNNLNYLFKEPDLENEDFHNELSDIWMFLNDEYISRYGIGEKYTKILSIKKKISLLKIDYYIRKNGISRTLFRIEEVKLKELLNVTEGISFDEAVIMIEEKMHREIDPKKITVVKYYDYINYMNKKKTA